MRLSLKILKIVILITSIFASPASVFASPVSVSPSSANVPPDPAGIAASIENAVASNGRVYFRNDSLGALGLKFMDYPLKNNPGQYEQYTLQVGGIGFAAANYSHVSPGATTLVQIVSSYDITLDSGGGGCWKQSSQSLPDPIDPKKSFTIFTFKIHDKFMMVALNNLSNGNINLSCIKR